MFDLLLFLVVLAPAPLLAIVVLAVRRRDAMRRGGAGTRAARTRAAWRGGTGRPVWPGLIAVAAVAAVLTVGLERSYLTAVTNGPRWGLDVVLLTIVLGLLAAIVCAALAGLAAAAVAAARGFGAGTVAGLLALVAVAAGTASAHLPSRATYLAPPAGSSRVLRAGSHLARFSLFCRCGPTTPLAYPSEAPRIGERVLRGDPGRRFGPRPTMSASSSCRILSACRPARPHLLDSTDRARRRAACSAGSGTRAALQGLPHRRQQRP